MVFQARHFEVVVPGAAEAAEVDAAVPGDAGGGAGREAGD